MGKMTVNLPCSPGDKLYWYSGDKTDVYTDYGEIFYPNFLYEAEVMYITIGYVPLCEGLQTMITARGPAEGLFGNPEFAVNVNALGKTVFFTREEAEKHKESFINSTPQERR